jgi:hypothetical protein
LFALRGRPLRWGFDSPHTLYFHSKNCVMEPALRRRVDRGRDELVVVVSPLPEFR